MSKFKHSWHHSILVNDWCVLGAWQLFSCDFYFSETKDFVELLFTTLENGSYDHNRPKTTIQAASSAATPSGGNLDAQKSRSPERQLSSTAVTLTATVKSGTMAAEPVAMSSIAVVTAPLARSDRGELSRTKSTSDRRSRSRDRGMVSQLGSRVHRKMSSRNEVNNLGVRLTAV